MKTLKNLLAVTILAMTIVSCADENKTRAEKAVDDYKSYVDSISDVKSDQLAEKWDAVETGYVNKKIEAESALENLKDRVELDKKLAATSSKYDEFKAKWIAEKQEMDSQKARNDLRNSLFTAQEIGEDTSFSWVNKSNILKTYETFVDNVSKNKDRYSREDWDEIKMLYEALDTRKNTVEKEGISTSDNLKIAGHKTRFATMHKINRMTAKSSENSEAKQ
jgi:predicted nucleic acid-binding protein